MPICAVILIIIAILVNQSDYNVIKKNINLALINFEEQRRAFSSIANRILNIISNLPDNFWNYNTDLLKLEQDLPIVKIEQIKSLNKS